MFTRDQSTIDFSEYGDDDYKCVTIDGEDYSVPSAVWEVFLQVSIERDHFYKMLYDVEGETKH